MLIKATKTANSKAGLMGIYVNIHLFIGEFLR